MARSHAADTTTYAQTPWSRAGSIASNGRIFPSPRFVVAAASICVAALVAALLGLAVTAQERMLNEAAADLDILARAVQRDAEAVAASRAALPDYVSARGRRVAVADATGAIVAATQDLPRGGALAGLFGADQALLIEFADKAGVMRVGLADGSRALATVRNLPSGARLAAIHPYEAALADWRGAMWREAALAALAAAAAGVAAFVWRRHARRADCAERAQADMSRRVDAALGSGRCGLWDWDLARGRIYWSDSMFELLGLDAERRHMSFGELAERLHPQDGDLAAIAEGIVDARSGGMDHQFRVRNGAGEWVWLRARAELFCDDAGATPRLVGIAVDISEQRALAEGAAAADMRLRDAIETISEAFVLWDAQNRLVACNSKFLDLHGLSVDAASPGASYKRIMSRAAISLENIEIVSRDAPSPRDRTYEAGLADGRWLQISERRTKDGGYVSVGADITALKRNQAQLLESERRLTASVADLMRSRQALEAQAQQLATLAEQYHLQKGAAEAAYYAKSRFLANMSHELRTPLNAIIGFSEVMKAQVFGALGSPKYVEYCNDILQSGHYLHDVLTDILDMSRLEAGRWRLEESDVDVSSAARAVMERFRRSAEDKKVELFVDVADGLRCKGDHDAIFKAIRVLVSNALKFTGPGGHVRVRTRRIGGAITIYVEDDGCGIEKSAISRLGRPFEQPTAFIENGMKGSGLGLAIARSLVALHGGAMRIRSLEKIGTVVMLRIPVGPPPRASQRPAFAVAV
jgi:two-component system cell cycle sensor histidine kinase PleC